MRILLVNDDGIYAPGILEARSSLSRLGEVFVVAPERPRSAAGHAITLHKPLRIAQVSLPGGTGYAVSGTPTDCVALGYDVIMLSQCDLVVSGINAGANLGWDVTYSGTVSAAMEGAVLGIPSLAVSLVLKEERDAAPDYTLAAEITLWIAQKILENPLPAHTLLNVNVPQGVVRGLRYTFQGSREYEERVVERHDPSGRPYYWQAGVPRVNNTEAGSDVHVLEEGYVSVTPLQLDMTNHVLAEKMRGAAFWHYPDQSASGHSA